MLPLGYLMGNKIPKPRSIQVFPETYRQLDKLRRTPHGVKSFSLIISELLDEHWKDKLKALA